MPIVENIATLVPVTKALHHVLPELVVPMDREYTQIFFGWHIPNFNIVSALALLRHSVHSPRSLALVNPSQYVNRGWNSSRTKVLDNVSGRSVAVD